VFLVALAYLAFFTIALPPSMLGVAWPSIQLGFGLPLSAAGLISPVGVATGLISTSLAARITARFGVGRVLAVGTLLSALGVTANALSVTWWQFLASVAFLGLVGGAIDPSLNAYVARWFGPSQITMLHACYGIGAAVSPLIVTATIASGAGWRPAYLIVAAVILVVGIVFAASRNRWKPTPVLTAATRTQRASTRVWTRNSVAGMVAVVVQTGIEMTVALWAFTFLTAHVGVGTVLAGTLASGYWILLVVGRIGFGQLAERVGAWRVLSIAMGLLITAAVLVNVPSPVAAVLAVVAFGLACAPVYPLLVLTTAERTSTEAADQVIGFQAGASSLGSAIVPGLVGLAIQRNSGAFAPALAILVVVAALVYLYLRHRRNRQAHQETVKIA
jgi:MFS family permease